MPFPRTPNFSMMAEKWPSAIVGRQQIEAFTGGIMTEKYLAILDSQRRGPRNRVRIGRKIGYLAHELILWLESRSEFVEVGGESTSNPKIQWR